MEQAVNALRTEWNRPFLIKYSGYAVFILAAVYFSFRSPSFLTAGNWINILVQSSVLGVVSCGMTAILIGGGNHVIKGGIDLSLANNLALNAAISAVMIGKGYPVWAALGAALLSSAAIGFVNALAVAVLKIIPLLATLSMMYLLQGVQLLLTENKVVSVSHPLLSSIANDSFLLLPIPLWFFIAVGLLMHLLFNHTVFGNWVYAVGGNRQAAEAAGVRVRLTLGATYVIAALTAAIAGLLAAARLSGSVPGIGDAMLLDVLLAGLMSAIFSRHAVPNMFGTVLSSLFVGMLSNGFTLINVPTYWVYAVKGSMILAAVAVTTTQQRSAV
ncbi:ABC transporter permease [Cohnella laeviribosi]|uniref:ABC transporter permease n=1 Tax=Cohnella laeviribosi TaxID=380174 RepID=UPI003D1961E9